MFLFKKIVSQFFFPMPVCLFFCFTGLALLWWTKKQNVGKILVTIGLLLLSAFSYAPIADALLAPLEQRYPIYVKSDGAPVKYIVVLGGGHNSNRDLPITSQISDESLKRLVEGIRVYRDNPGSKFILSGGSWPDSVPDAQIMADMAILLGIIKTDIILEPTSKDTADEARFIGPMVETNGFMLVTSANHLPRSMTLFERHGLHPRPVPAQHLIEPSTSFNRLIPSSHCLGRSERAFYEYMGLVWAQFTR